MAITASNNKIERFAEYGWKPHRMLIAKQIILQASVYRYLRTSNRGYGFIEFEMSNNTIS